MFYSSALLVFIVQLALAIVVSKAQNDAATIPTELFKPLQPNTGRTNTNSQLVIPQGSPSRNDLPQGNPSQNVSPQGNFGGTDLEKFFNLGDVGNSNVKYKIVTSSSSDGSNLQPIFTQQQGPIQRTFRIQSPSVTQRWSSGPDLSDFDTSSGNGYYKILSKSSYYDSSMSEPVVRQYEFDSRNGGTPPSSDVLFSFN